MDSAPVRGDGYAPGSSKFRLRANAETSHSVRAGPGGEKFSDGEISKTTTVGTPYDNDYYTILLLRHLYDPT